MKSSLKKINTILIIILITTFSCNKSNDISESNNAIPSSNNVDPREKNKIKFSQYSSPLDQRVHKFATYVPNQSLDPKPLIIFLHGAGDVNREFTYMGPLKEIAEYNRKFDFIIASIHNDYNGWRPDVVHEFLGLIKRSYKVDNSRIYITGMSMGAFGTFNYAITYPEDMTAIVPLAGGVSAPYMPNVCNLKDIPTWAFHSIDDTRVPYQRSKSAIDAIANCNGSIVPILTTYDNNYDHSISEITYHGNEGHDIYSWMLQQVKK